MRINFRKHIAPYLFFLVAFVTLFTVTEPVNFVVFYVCFFFSVVLKNWEG